MNRPESEGVTSPVRRPTGLGRRGVLTVLACAPAVLGAALAFTAAVVAVASTPSALATAYLREADASSRSGDFANAALCLDRVCRLQPGVPAHRFSLALALSAAGESERALALTRALAPPDQPGYAPAQVRLAAGLLRQRPLPRARVADAETHLRRALDADPDSDDAHHLIGELYAATGRPADAETHLSRVAPRRPEVLNLLVTVCETQGNDSTARRWADLAVFQYQKRAEADPSDGAWRVRWAEALVRKKDHAGAARVIEAGLTLKATPALRREYGEILSAWSDSLGAAGETEAPRLALLDRGLKVAPAHEGLLDRLAGLLRTAGPESGKARARLEALLADGGAAPSAHFLLGIDAHRRGEVEAARVHFGQAFRLAPGSPALANNLAWSLAGGKNADPERALALIDSALARAPGHPQFLGTRGHILVKLGRWAEALPDLERALRAENGLAELHDDLATAYEALGVPEMASAHRERATGAGRPPAPRPRTGKPPG